MPEAGYIYIVHGIGTSYIKVGQTTDIERRLRDIGKRVPFDIRVLLVELVHDMDVAERALKARYQAFHARGEWFDLSTEALAQWPAVTKEIAPRKVKPVTPIVRLVPTKPTTQERIVTLLQKRGSMNAREMQQCLFGVKASETKAVLPKMIESGTLHAYRKGKTAIYALAETDLDEQGLA